MQEIKLSALIAAVETIAKEKFDGHYSLFSFTTNHKGCYGTPVNIDGINADIHGEYKDVLLRDDLENLPAHKSLEELLYYMAERPDNYVIHKGEARQIYAGNP